MSCGGGAQTGWGRVALLVALASCGSASRSASPPANGDAGDADIVVEVSTDAAPMSASNDGTPSIDASAEASMTEGTEASAPADTMTEIGPDSGATEAASPVVSDAGSDTQPSDAFDDAAATNGDASKPAPLDAALSAEAGSGRPCSSTQCSLDGTSMNICNKGSCQPCTSDEQCLLSYGEIDYICSGGACGNF